MITQVENGVSTAQQKWVEVLLKVRQDDRVVSIKGIYTVEELKGIIGRCDLFIGTFMHANIAAISMSVPTIAIAHSQKTWGIMKMVGLEEYVWDLRRMVYEELVLKVDKAWEKRDKIREDMGHFMQSLKESEPLSIRLVNEFLVKKARTQTSVRR